MINQEIFRAYDIRGIVDQTLREEDVFLIGKAVGTQTVLLNSTNPKTNNKVIVARDGRLSGIRLIEQLKQGILATGCEVIDLGLVPTPVLYFATYHLNIKSAVMVTGSHNPINYNGLKIILDGNAIYGSQILALRELIINNKLINAKCDKVYQQNLINEYINYIVNNIIINTKGPNLLKIVVDCGNGAAGVVAEKLFNAMNVACIPLYCEVDGNFPNHHPDPLVPENLRDLIAKVLLEKADLGIAFDGDGDRLGIVDNNGEIIWPDYYLMLFIEDILKKNPKNLIEPGEQPVIIYDIKSTNLLEKFILKLGGKPLLWKTGHSLIKAKMRTTKALLGGEMSGHVFFQDRWFGFDDGLYTAARLIELIANKGKSLHDLCMNLPKNYSTPELMIPIKESKKQKIIQQLIIKAKTLKEVKIITIDGLRLEFANSWGLIRASNTTANLIARFEAVDMMHLNQVQTLFKNYLLAIDPDLSLTF